MKVFLSWSGRVSRAVAEALREWLPLVIPRIEPWMSSEDIDKGSRWSDHIAGRLNESRCGIVCLTPENLEAPWVMFEAGALSKTLSKTFVCPYLYNIKASDLRGPLVQFQATLADEPDTRKLLQTINASLEEQALEEKVLFRLYEKFWPELNGTLAELEKSEPTEPPMRTDRDLLEEILLGIRGLQRDARSPMVRGFWPEISPGTPVSALPGSDLAYALEPSLVGEHQGAYKLTPLEGPHGKPVELRFRPASVGRNDPCPCGSGKKYKNCCGKVSTDKRSENGPDEV